MIDGIGNFTGNAATGSTLYSFGIGGTDPGCQFCHGADGLRAPPFGGIDPLFEDFPGFLASANPWELQHKILYGQPGQLMPGIAVEGGTEDQANDIGAHAQTLPTQ